MSKSSIKYSFIIITDGQRSYSLQRLLLSIRKQDIPDHEIIIAGKLCEDPRSPVTYVERPDLAEAGAICRLRNIGIARAAGTVLIILDDDVELTDTWFLKLSNHINTAFDIAGCKVLSLEGKRWQDWCWASRTDPSCSSRLIDYHDCNREVYIGGSCMIIKKHVFDVLQFNEGLINYRRDDADFCHRAHDFNMKFMCFSDMIVFHHFEHENKSIRTSKSGQVRFLRGIYNLRKGKYLDALNWFAGCGDHEAQILYHVGLTLKYMGKFDAAKKYFENTIEIIKSPGNSLETRIYCSAQFHLAQLSEMNGNLQDAVRFYKLTLQGLPEHIHAAKFPGNNISGFSQCGRHMNEAQP